MKNFNVVILAKDPTGGFEAHFIKGSAKVKGDALVDALINHSQAGHNLDLVEKTKVVELIPRVVELAPKTVTLTGLNAV